MNSQVLTSPPAHVELWHKEASPAELHADTVAPRPAITIADIIIDGGCAAEDQMVAPAPRRYSIAALEDAVWMVPDGDGWAEVYGDGDGWPVWDVETWAPAVSYGDRWVVPDGDGWCAYEPHES